MFPPEQILWGPLGKYLWLGIAGHGNVHYVDMGIYKGAPGNTNWRKWKMKTWRVSHGQ